MAADGRRRSPVEVSARVPGHFGTVVTPAEQTREDGPDAVGTERARAAVSASGGGSDSDTARVRF